MAVIIIQIFYPPTKSWLVWNKRSFSSTDRNDFADCELAWCSKGVARVINYVYNGMIQGDMKNKDYRFHPCLPENEEVFFNGTWKKIKDVQIGDKNTYGTVIDKTTHIAKRLVKISVGEHTTTATYNHPFLVLRDNAIWWIEAEQIKQGDKILWRNHTNLPKKAMIDTHSLTENSLWNIEEYGKTITGQSPKVCKFTTKTSTKLIMTFPICNLLRPLNTNGCTRVAFLSTESGISLVPSAANTKNATKIIGILAEGGLTEDYVNSVTAKKVLKSVEFSLQTVGSVKIIEKETQVYNLTIKGIPAFDTRIGVSHNTQKPTQLWIKILNLYTKKNDLILDPFAGSQSLRIACHKTQRHYIGAELDKDYYEKGCEWFKQVTSQMSIFDILSS